MAKPSELIKTTSASADGTETDNEPRFTFDDLLAELKNEDEYRRDSALTLAYHAKLLVDLRAAANESSFEDEWRTIFDSKKLFEEIDGEDPKRRRAALNVLDDVSHVDALRAAEEGPITLEDRLWAIEVRARLLHKIDELCAAHGVPLDKSRKN